jgi:hypothetical protein
LPKSKRKKRHRTEASLEKASDQRLHGDAYIEIQDKKGSNLFMKDLKAAGR